MEIVYQSGMETNSSELEAIFDSIWKNLKLGAIDRKHPFHLCTLSTINSKNTSFPDSRIVVLREADQNLLTLHSHADVRTNKCEDIKQNKHTQLLFYDKSSKIQVRIKAESEIIVNKSIISAIWEKSQEVSQRCYFVPLAPSTEIETPFNNNMLDLKNKNLGLNVFALLTSKVKEIDWLELNYDGHRRCKFEISDSKLSKSVWLIP